MNKTLHITFNPDWEHSLREAGTQAKRGMETGQYQGDYMNYAVPSMFFDRLTAHRWDIVNRLMGQGTVGWGGMPNGSTKMPGCWSIWGCLKKRHAARCAAHTGVSRSM